MEENKSLTVEEVLFRAGSCPIFLATGWFRNVLPDLLVDERHLVDVRSLKLFEAWHLYWCYFPVSEEELLTRENTPQKVEGAAIESGHVELALD